MNYTVTGRIMLHRDSARQPDLFRAVVSAESAREAIEQFQEKAATELVDEGKFDSIEFYPKSRDDKYEVEKGRNLRRSDAVPAA